MVSSDHQKPQSDDPGMMDVSDGRRYVDFVGRGGRSQLPVETEAKGSDDNPFELPGVQGIDGVMT